MRGAGRIRRGFFLRDFGCKRNEMREVRRPSGVEALGSILDLGRDLDDGLGFFLRSGPLAATSCRTFWPMPSEATLFRAAVSLRVLVAF
jgi:hypothetical protein